MEQRTSLAEIIEYIDPGSLSYQDWVNGTETGRLSGKRLGSVESERFQQVSFRRMRTEMENLFWILFTCNWWDDRSDGNRTWLGT